jgi:hypothetical protein
MVGLPGAGLASLLLGLQPQTRHELKGLRLSGHEKSAIVKTDREPTIFAALDYFADLTLQRYLGSPCESFSDQPDSIANLESALGRKPPYCLALSPSSTRRRMASESVGISGCFSAHFTIEARITGSARNPISGVVPLRGRPMTFCLTGIVFFILFV